MKKSYGYKRVLEKKLMFRYLLDDVSSSPCVFALVNEKDKRIYIQASGDPLIAIARVTSELACKTFSNKIMRADRKQLRLLFLQKYETRAQGIYRKLKWQDSFIRKGYVLYNKEHRPQYRIRTQFIDDTTLEVQIVSKGKRVKPIKQFKSDIEAKDFILRNSVWDMLELVEKK